MVLLPSVECLYNKVEQAFYLFLQISITVNNVSSQLNVKPCVRHLQIHYACGIKCAKCELVKEP